MGTVTLLLTHAATPSSSFEPEDGVKSSGATVIADTNASAQAAVKFNIVDTGGGGTVNVATGEQLAAALANARPGDVIKMANGSYDGKLLIGKYTGAFGIVKSGTAAAPITLTGSRNAIIDAGGTGSHYGIYISGANYWNISGISVTNASKGIVLDGGNHFTFDNIRVYNIGSEAVHFRASSSDNVIKNSLVEQTGVKQAQYGEGIYIGSANSNWATYSNGQPDASNRNQVLNNVIRNTGAENIDIKEGTVDGIIDGNQFDGVGIQGENSADSWIDVKGNNYIIRNNTAVVSQAPGAGMVFSNGFEIHVAVTGWGQNNVFHNNKMDLNGWLTAGSKTSGFGFYQQSGAAGNILSCDNIVTNAPSGFGVFNVTAKPCNDN